jgi:tetratricopeptide (TPR) repeat protein
VKIDAGSVWRMVDAYRSVIEHPEDNLPYFINSLADLFQATGHLVEAGRLYEALISQSKDDPNNLQGSFGNQALILKMRGHYDGTMAILKEQERICREFGNVDGLQASLGNQALILKTIGDLDGAMALHKEEERICRELGNIDSLSKSLGNQALILAARGDLDGAIAHHKEVERIFRKLGNLESLAKSLVNQSLILRQKGDTPKVNALIHEAYELAAGHGYVVPAKEIKKMMR